MTHFLLQTIEVFFPKSGWHCGGGYPRVAPTILAPCQGKFPLSEGANQTYVPAQLSGPHILLEFPVFAEFVRVPKWYLSPLVEYYLHFTEG